MTARFERGQRVIRDMGIAGGHWVGVIRLLPGDPRGDVCIPEGRCVVQFGGDDGMGIGFDIDDPCLSAAPDDLGAVAEADRERREKYRRDVCDFDKPQWPRGYFGGDEPERPE